MIWIIVAIGAVVLLSILLIYKILRLRELFGRMRLVSLSTAADCDSVGGVGISVLVASPAGVSVVVNLLDSRYPLSEVVVALNEVKSCNLLAQLKIRYALMACSSAQCVVYRSRDRAFRRLVVVVAREECDREQLYDLAASNALFEYLLRVPDRCYLFATAVGRVAEVLAAEVSKGTDVVTTQESGLILLSRREWLARGGFAASEGGVAVGKVVYIAEPLALCRQMENDDYMLIERSRYNFWDFLALYIMKSGNKLLSLVKTA